MRRPALLLLPLAVLGGCALWPYSEAECRGMNWRSRGYADGFGGNSPQDLRLARDCGRFGIPVPDDYFAGWREGYDEWYRMIGSIGMN